MSSGPAAEDSGVRRQGTGFVTLSSSVAGRHVYGHFALDGISAFAALCMLAKRTVRPHRPAAWRTAPVAEVYRAQGVADRSLPLAGRGMQLSFRVVTCMAGWRGQWTAGCAGSGI